MEEHLSVENCPNCRSIEDEIEKGFFSSSSMTIQVSGFKLEVFLTLFLLSKGVEKCKNNCLTDVCCFFLPLEIKTTLSKTSIRNK